jgi:hypothetical protein
VKVRKYAGKERGLQKGDEEIFCRSVYLHIYFHPSRKVEEDISFDDDLIELRKNIESGARWKAFPTAREARLRSTWVSSGGERQAMCRSSL